MRDAIEIAAQLWCEDKHSHKEMDSDFCESIAAAIRSAQDEAWNEAVEAAAQRAISRMDEHAPNSWTTEVRLRVAEQIRTLKRPETRGRG